MKRQLRKSFSKIPFALSELSVPEPEQGSSQETATFLLMSKPSTIV